MRLAQQRQFSGCDGWAEQAKRRAAAAAAVDERMKGVVVAEPSDTDYIIAIPSYHRLECFRKRTYTRILQRYNLCGRAHLYLQNPEDIAAYSAAFPELTIHGSLPGLMPTMERIGKDWPVNKWIAVLHDDLTRVLTVGENGKRETVDDLDGLLTRTFDQLETLGLHLAGFYPTSDPRSMARGPEFTTDLRFINDPLHLVRNLRLPLSIPGKQDFERTVKYYEHDGGVLRLNRYAFAHTYNPTGDTGGYGHRTPLQEAAAVRAFCDVYGQYVERVITHEDGSTSMVLRRGGATR
jgi:hypothetical protein